MEDDQKNQNGRRPKKFKMEDDQKNEIGRHKKIQNVRCKVNQNRRRPPKKLILNTTKKIKMPDQDKFIFVLFNFEFILVIFHDDQNKFKWKMTKNTENGRQPK